MPAPAASEAAIARALCAAQKAGLNVTGFSVARDGTVRVECAKAPETEAEALDSSRKSGQVVKPKQWSKG